MDEPTWQIELLRAGINITKLDTNNNLVYFDFAYRPKPGAPRVWGKSVYAGDVSGVREFVLELRKGLEG